MVEEARRWIWALNFRWGFELYLKSEDFLWHNDLLFSGLGLVGGAEILLHNDILMIDLFPNERLREGLVQRLNIEWDISTNSPLAEQIIQLMETTGEEVSFLLFSTLASYILFQHCSL